MGFRFYQDEESKDIVLERNDGSLVKLPQGSDEGTYQVPADVVQELAAARCDQTQQAEEVKEGED